MKEMSLREIQLDALAILISFSEFCDNYKLRFNLAGGTLLGAIRHQGFIPWDDDIDVCMPRPDYERFFQLDHTFFQEKGFYVQKGAYGKISDIHTKLVSQFRLDDKYVTMDIFPIDGLPDSLDEVKKIYQKTNFYREIYRLNNAKIGEAKTFTKKIVKPFFILGARLIGEKYCINKLREISSHYDYNTSKYIGAVTWGLYGVGERMLKSEYEKTIMVNFEGKKFPTYSCWDSYLKGIYGDYMKIPPVEKRQTHHMKVFKV